MDGLTSEESSTGDESVDMSDDTPLERDNEGGDDETDEFVRCMKLLVVSVVPERACPTVEIRGSSPAVDGRRAWIEGLELSLTPAGGVGNGGWYKGWCEEPVFLCLEPKFQRLDDANVPMRSSESPRSPFIWSTKASILDTSNPEGTTSGV